MRWTNTSHDDPARNPLHGLCSGALGEHFETRLEAMEGKAMIVCMSRRICVELYKAITKIRPDWHNDDDSAGILKIVMTG